jgi:hypothetical protein
MSVRDGMFVRCFSLKSYCFVNHCYVLLFVVLFSCEQADDSLLKKGNTSPINACER